MIRDEKELEYVTKIDSVSKKEYQEPTRLTEQFLKYCGLECNFRTISREVALKHKENGDRIRLNAYKYKDYYVALNHDDKIIAFTKTDEQAKNHSDITKHVMLKFLTTNNEKNLEDIIKNIEETEYSLENILRMFEGFYVK